jgi:hypothetical protein
MTQRILVATAVGTAWLLAATAASAQAPPPAGDYTPPKTPWGEPDLQGTFSNRTITPMERSRDLGERVFFTPEEALALESRAQESSGDEERSVGTRGGVERAYTDVWWGRGTELTSLRSSLVVDPPDGRVPAITEEARRRQAEEGNQPVYRSAGAAGGRGMDSFHDRSTFERCITRGMPGAMSPSAYNNNYRITQSPGYVAIEIEMLGGTRVIPTDGRRHLSPSIRNWMGDSVGRWEGNTLVVETTNLSDKVLYRGAAGNLRLVERFTRLGPGEIDYRVTIEDPTTFVSPWTMAIAFVDTGEGIFEYACHEGKYGMVGMLYGARQEEQAAAAAGR